MTRIDRIWTTMTALTAAAGLTYFATSFGDEPKTGKDNNTTTQTTNKEKPRGFLGVMVDDVHPAIASHISGVDFNGQGLMIERVDAKSAAAKAGLKVHDILMTYEDQKLFAPEQLMRLVSSDRPGNSITIGLIREGKQQKVKVELGERPAEWDRIHEQEWVSNSGLNPWGHHGHHDGQLNGHGHGRGTHPAWNSFDSMTLKKLDKDRFHATISYTDKEGKIKKHDFEGTHDEIHTQIENDKDLMPNERIHLLRSLDADGEGMPFFLGMDEGPFDF